MCTASVMSSIRRSVAAASAGQPYHQGNRVLIRTLELYKMEEIG